MRVITKDTLDVKRLMASRPDFDKLDKLKELHGLSKNIRAISTVTKAFNG